MKEKYVIRAVREYLQLYENQGKLYFIHNSSGAVRTASGGFMHFGKSGSPDFIVFLPNKTIFLECKSSEGKLSPAQVKCSEIAYKLGITYIVVKEAKDIKQLWTS